MQRRDLMEIVEERYGRRSTVITSQLPPETWHEVIADSALPTQFVSAHPYEQMARLPPMNSRASCRYRTQFAHEALRWRLWRSPNATPCYLEEVLAARVEGV